MTALRRIRSVSAPILLCAVMAASRPVGWAQIAAPVLGSPGPSDRSGRRSTDDDMDAARMALPASYARMQNTERQRRLVTDTERLIYLTNQLKVSIETSGAEALTPEMLRQMDEIEKLARSVKNKMRN